MPGLTRAELLAAATAFCDSFAQKKPLEEILSHFASACASTCASASHADAVVVVHEHGLPQLAPFLGRDFCGLDGARTYFEIVASCLSYEDMRFVEFVADTASSDQGGKQGDVSGVGVERGEGEGEGEGKKGGGGGGGGGGKVVVRGMARFTWTETGHSWDETFVYVLRFDARAKLTRYEIWADSGAAYLARRGEL
ncbi:transcription elongation factor S-II [Xylaria sp. FL1777]|nr:transcription elongation factor S-II [Xylaria sp. FL1777]